MSDTKRIIIAAIAVAIIAGGAVWYVLATSQKQGTPSDADMPGMSHADHQAMSNNNSSDTNKPVAATITYNGASFSLSANTVTSGSLLKVVNDSKNELDMDSDPHPTHTNNPELNQGDIATGSSKTFTLTTKGTWGFHNHHDPTQHANITVE
jgi:hypothetical protein